MTGSKIYCPAYQIDTRFDGKLTVKWWTGGTTHRVDAHALARDTYEVRRHQVDRDGDDEYDVTRTVDDHGENPSVTDIPAPIVSYIKRVHELALVSRPDGRDRPLDVRADGGATQ